MPILEPARLLDDLNDAQREAVQATEGPLAILAGAGSGKTRVVSRRTAYAIATDLVPVDQVLVVTFTAKAAKEMVERLDRLDLPGVTARTFHAHALSQLRHFWPIYHDGAVLPELLESKAQLLAPLVQGLGPPYRFTPVKDVADEIEWAKSRRLTPETYELAVAGTKTVAGRKPPMPQTPVGPWAAGPRMPRGIDGCHERIPRWPCGPCLPITAASTLMRFVLHLPRRHCHCSTPPWKSTAMPFDCFGSRPTG